MSAYIMGPDDEFMPSHPATRDNPRKVHVQREGECRVDVVDAYYDHAARDWILLLPEGPTPARRFRGYARGA